ncbi:MAG: OmpH family outer membrane protein [Planctomycetales bacterium]|nr:OmpH family outer membrane protein [Planctomycetales bacterium]
MRTAAVIGGLALSGAFAGAMLVPEGRAQDGGKAPPPAPGAAAAPGAPPQAATGSAPKVGFVNIRGLLADFKKTGELDEDIRQRQARAEAKTRDLENQRDEIQKKLGLSQPGTELYKDEYKKLVQQEREIEFHKKWTRFDLDNEMARSTIEVYKDALAGIKAVATQEGYGLVLKIEDPQIDSDSVVEVQGRISWRTVLYHDPAHDLTAKVLEHMNREHAKMGGAAKPPEKGADGEKKAEEKK